MEAIRIKGEKRKTAQTPIKEKLAEIWSRILGVDVSFHDNFFNIGGNSLAAAMIICRVRDVFKVDLPVNTIFRTPTVNQLSFLIQNPLVNGISYSRGEGRLTYEDADMSWEWAPPPSLQQTAQKTIRTMLNPIAKVKMEGQENIPESGPIVVTTNHINWLDSPVIFGAIREFFCHISDQPAIIASHRWRIPFHWYFKQFGQPLYIRRGNGELGVLNRALAVLLSRGLVAIAPEGTHDHGKLIKGQVGVAYLATQAPAPVLPIALYGQDRTISCWKQLKRVPLNVRIGQPINLPPSDASHKGMEAYTAQVMTAIARLLPPEYRGVYKDIASM